MKRKMIGFLILLVLTILSSTAVCGDSFDPQNALREHEALKQAVFVKHPDVEVLDMKDMISMPEAAIIVFRKDDMYGVMICERVADGEWSIAAYNERLFHVTNTGTILLDEQKNHDPFIWYEDMEQKESYYLTIGRIKRTWTIVHMFFDRSSHPTQYRLSEDRQHLVVTDLIDPQIYWPIDIDLSLSNFSVEKACQACERAIAYMYDENMRRNNSYEHVVIWEQDDY
ncbi:MAG: hypothetical protein GX104_06060 [Spirochaetales bacterium]|jgi:hypothetical protein|nr:hypothetical protein [Spirochaetales bacterium]